MQENGLNGHFQYFVIFFTEFGTKLKRSFLANIHVYFAIIVP